MAEKIDWSTVPREVACSRPDWFAAWLTRDDSDALQFQVFEHIAYISQVIADAIRQGRGRLIINLPPQHGKSWLLCRWLIVWVLEHWPDLRVASASYSKDLILEHASFVRDQFALRDELNTKLKADSRAVGRWHTMTGTGGLYSTTIGGAISGFSVDVGLVDDPYKDWTDAWSPATRSKVRKWFDSAFYTRRQENTTFIVLHTRWHPDDLTGYLLKEHPDDWQHIRLPAIAEENDPMGRTPGSVLCPELHSYKSLMGSKASDGVWPAVYQQDPKGLGDSALYHHFSEQRNVDGQLEYRPDYPLHLAIDFNKRPGTHMLLGQYWEDKDIIVTLDEFYGDRWDTQQIMRDFVDRWWKENASGEASGGMEFSEIHVFGDSAGRSESVYTSDSGYKIIRQFLDKLENITVHVRVPKKAPAILDSVASVNNALCDITDKTHWQIHPRCKKLIRDLQEVMPDEHGKPDKDADFTLTHASDAERYRIHRIRRLRPPSSGTNKVNV